MSMTTPRASTRSPTGPHVFGIEWNAENRLTAVKQGGNTLASFTYDGKGSRATKTAAGVTTSYVYDGALFLEERPGAGTAKRYVYGLGIDRPLAQSVGGATAYFLADHLGSIAQVTDAAGAPTLTREYDQWGNLLQGSTTGGYAFTGREWDPESGLHYYRARYYSSLLGRFVSEDPLGLAGGDLNAYRYVGNGPVVARDPSGLFETIDAAGIGAMLEISRRSDWKRREYHCYIYYHNNEYCYTSLTSFPLGVPEGKPDPFRGPGRAVGEVHNHFNHPEAVDPETFSPADYNRNTHLCSSSSPDASICYSYLLTPSERMLRLDSFAGYPSVYEARWPSLKWIRVGWPEE